MKLSDKKSKPKTMTSFLPKLVEKYVDNIIKEENKAIRKWTRKRK